MNIAAAVNENFANYSNYLIRSAMFVYALAFLAHLAEWVFGGRSRIAVQSARRRGRPRRHADAAAPSRPVQVTQRGAAAPPRSSGPKVVTRASASDRGIADGPGAAGGNEKGDLYGRIAVSFTVLAWLLHAGGVLFRGRPCSGPRGATCTSSPAPPPLAVGAYLRRCSPPEERPLARPVPGHHGAARPRPGLHGALHRRRATGAGAALVLAVHPRDRRDHLPARFYVAAVATMLYLFRDRYEEALAAGRRRPARWADICERLPSAAAWTSSRTGSSPSSSRCGPSRSSPARSGPRPPGAATGAGTPRRPGPSSPGSSTPLPARAGHRRLEGPQGRAGADRLRVLPVQLLRREHLRHRQALLRGRLTDAGGAAGGSGPGGPRRRPARGPRLRPGPV